MKNMPKVFVGVPVYNEEVYIGELLESIHRQEYSNMKVLISDNASTDNTWKIIQSYVKKDKRFSAYRQPENIGASNNFNYVLENSSGNYIIFAGGHDIWGKNMILRCVNAMEKDQTLILACPVTRWIDSSGNIINTNDGENIDTRKEISQAGRVFTFWTQINRCSSFYGLFKQEFIKNVRTPNIVNSDFYILVKAAAQGNIITVMECEWFRRVIRTENSTEKRERYSKILNLNFFSKRFPLLVSRIACILFFLTCKGSLKNRIRLLKYAVKKYFFNKAQLKILLRELIGRF